MLDYNDKIIIVGGSNGIGLAIAKELRNRGYGIIIVDREKPDSSVLTDDSTYKYYECDLLDYQTQLFEDLAREGGINGLIVTAGFGRVADFENISDEEISNMFSVNSVTLIRTIGLFYSKIMSQDDFYVAVMGSIAGLVSSPMFSVYAATKAAVCRFVESVNIELEVKGTNNRILNVSPGSIKGTRFNGSSQNDLSQMSDLAHNIVEKMFNRETLYIPQYDEIFKGVIERYQNDPHEYGLHSYEYKQNSGRKR